MFSKTLPVDERLNIIEKEYDIPLENDVKEAVNDMCNLSQGIREDAARKTSEEYIFGMYEYGYDYEKIAHIAKKSVDEVKSIIEKKKETLD